MAKEDVLLFGTYGMKGAGKSYYEKLKEKDEEIKRLKEEIKGYEQERERVLNVIDERNHKAIEYIKEKARNNCWIDQYEANDLIKILKGVDKE